MKLLNSKKIILIAWGILIFFPLFSFAAQVRYGKILSESGDSLIIQYGNLEYPNYYNCAISTLACVNLGTTLPLPENVIKPTNTYRRFVLSFDSAKNKNNHLRSFILKDNNTGKKYTRSYKVNYWDLLSEESTLSVISPDEKTLVYLDDINGYPMLYQVNLTSLKGSKLKGKPLFTKPFSISGFTFTSSTSLYFIADKENTYEWNLYKYDLKTKTTSIIENSVSYAFRIRKVSNGLVFFKIQKSSSFPVFYNEQKDKVEQFSLPAPEIPETTINRKFISLNNNLYGALLTPLNFDKNTPHKLLIWLHGGPYQQTSLGYHPYLSYAVYDWILDETVKNDVVVLKLDYRGSYGHGKLFAESIKGEVGSGDVLDVTNALASIKKDLNVSETYLMGNSYGGYLALRSLVSNPNKFQGAISINGVTDWAVMLQNLHNSIFNIYFNGIPNKKNKKLYNQASIISRIPRLTNQKIVLIQAQADQTIPPSQADLLYQALEKKGKKVEFYPYDDEDHVFKKKSSIQGICKNVFTTLSLPLENNCNFQ